LLEDCEVFSQSDVGRNAKKKMVEIKTKVKMRKIVLLLFILSINLTFSQNKTEAEKLVDEGVAYHDKGDYDGAVSKYSKALELDKDNLLALAEKAFTLNSLKKYDESISICKLAIEKHPKDNSLKNVYVTYGNALDELKKTDEAFAVYDDGLKVFPEYYQLHFNKGITYSSIRKYDEAILSFQQAILINPKHASSNNAIARLEKMNGRKIPAILAFCRFLITEPQSARAKENLNSLKELISANVKKTGENSVSVTIDSKMLSEDTKNGKPKENDFSSTELISTMDVALDFDEKNVNKTEVENFIRKFETICASLSEMKKKNYGFYWYVYAPYFIEMKKNNLIEPFAYIVYASSETKDVNEWLDKNQKELDKFYDWSKNYKWKTN
jgi:Tfp pilus assembly protein PilF